MQHHHSGQHGWRPKFNAGRACELPQSRPEMASLIMGSMMRISGPYAGIPFSNMPEEIESYVKQMKEVSVKPELEVYSHSMLRDVRNWSAKV
jgi:3-keto-5-aminohexanoate cleavage enzyme